MRETFIKTRRLVLIVIAAAGSFAQQFHTAQAQSTASSGSQAEALTTTPFVNSPSLIGTRPFDEAPSGQDGIDRVRVKFTALLTDNGPILSQGVIWRIFIPDPSGGVPSLVKELRAATPTVELSSRTYMINVAFGLAHLTRTIRVTAGTNRQEKFVINAGGLRLDIKPNSANFWGPVNATFDLLNDERDQFGNRQKIMGNIRPGRITRLNSGIYHIISRLGDVNAVVTSEITIEAGKLTEATVFHEAAKVTFKLVQAPGDDALAGAQWVIMTSSGKVVKETAGALPTHVLAPGDYTINASWGGRLYKRAFKVKSGENVEVEVIIQ